MSVQDNAQALIDTLDDLHANLLETWQGALNAGDNVKAKAAKTEADRASDQLVTARQSLLAAIDGGQNISALTSKIASVQTKLADAKAKTAADTAIMTDVSAVLNTVDQLLQLVE